MHVLQHDGLLAEKMLSKRTRGRKNTVNRQHIRKEVLQRFKESS